MTSRPRAVAVEYLVGVEGRRAARKARRVWEGRARIVEGGEVGGVMCVVCEAAAVVYLGVEGRLAMPGVGGGVAERDETVCSVE